MVMNVSVLPKIEVIAGVVGESEESRCKESGLVELMDSIDGIPVRFWEY